MLTYHNIHKLHSYRFVKILLVLRYFELIIMSRVDITIVWNMERYLKNNMFFVSTLTSVV